MKLSVVYSHQNGKAILVGSMTAAEIIGHLLSESMAVNPVAQRSLTRGTAKESTKELLEDDRIHKTARMKSFINFVERVQAKLEEGIVDEGFFGAIQLAVPDSFQKARLIKIPDDASPHMMMLRSALKSHRGIAIFEAEPSLGETVLFIGDGQGRCYGFYSLERVLKDRITKARRDIKKLEGQGKDVAIERANLAKCEALLERARRYLSETDVPFVIYASHILPDGTVVGLDEQAQKRLYIEGNALNSQAAQEENVKFEAFSPVVLALKEDRMADGNVWMSEEFIEDDAKSIPAKSSKNFTLSALVQSYSLSAIGKPDPISNLTPETFEMMGEHRDFVREAWAKVSRVFGPTWAPPGMSSSERLSYVMARRAEQNVLLQAIFLQALGKLIFAMGEAAKWQVDANVLGALETLNPRAVDYRARPENFDMENPPIWTDLMMKAKFDKATGLKEGFAFNNTRDTVTNTYRWMLKKTGISAPAVEPAEAHEPEMAEV
jgi:hypothetical protein